MTTLNLDSVHTSWLPCLKKALLTLEPNYLNSILQSTHCLPHQNQILNAFSVPLENIKYLLIGESPYPRKESANGFAFWDASVKELWSEKGLSTKVNRATSLRNLIKMLLFADGLLPFNQLTQKNIAHLNKSHLVSTNDELFSNFINRGFLLLNASLVLRLSSKRQDAKAWYPFIQYIILNCLKKTRNPVKILLFGQIANPILHILENHSFDTLVAEHPYNLSFITNKKVMAFFKPLHLLHKNSIQTNSLDGKIHNKNASLVCYTDLKKIKL